MENKKKIGILSLPLHTNYGGILQSYALKTALEKIGNEVWLIERESAIIPPVKKVYLLGKSILKKYVLLRKGVNISYISNRKKKKKIEVTRQHTQRFINRYFDKRTGSFYSSDELKRNIEKYMFDACVVGSDQVWRPRYAGEKLTDYFLGFLPKNNRVKKVSYAASFGTADWEFSESQKVACKELLKDFDAVSVREDSGVKLCKEYFNVDALQVLDPTLLLDKADYLDLIKGVNITKDELFVYLLDRTPDKDDTINKVNAIVNGKIFSIGKVTLKEEMANSNQQSIAVPVEDWIKGFANAKFVITDSFHGCAFSILFNKPFIAYASKTRGLSRFTSLLSMFGLDDRLIYSSQELKENLTSEIDWDNVNAILKDKKGEAFKFLQEALQ